MAEGYSANTDHLHHFLHGQDQYCLCHARRHGDGVRYHGQHDGIGRWYFLYRLSVSAGARWKAGSAWQWQKVHWLVVVGLGRHLGIEWFGHQPLSTAVSALCPGGGRRRHAPGGADNDQQLVPGQGARACQCHRDHVRSVGRDHHRTLVRLDHFRFGLAHVVHHRRTTVGRGDGVVDADS
ncbi:hypothetical protein D3C80_1333450 [compost metagenome]